MDQRSGNSRRDPLTTGTVILSDAVRAALHSTQPVVALESTVITHGLPQPQNLELARNMETEVRQNGAVPATVAVLDGRLRIGVTDSELERLAGREGMRKISRRDIPAAMLQKASGGTTVAGTLFAARQAGIRVMATGGIGGIHLQPPHDMSADLPTLAGTDMIVVCAGAKAILDLPATLEYLETHSIPVVGYQTDEFPAFFAQQSGLPVSIRLETPQEVVEFARLHWGFGEAGAVLVTNPPPPASALDPLMLTRVIQQAQQEATSRGIRGQELTPFLLEQVLVLTGGASLRVNLDLLLNNARLAAQIACAFQSRSRRRIL